MAPVLQSSRLSGGRWTLQFDMPVVAGDLTVDVSGAGACGIVAEQGGDDRTVTVFLPQGVLSDGIQVITLGLSGIVVARMILIAGEAAADDLRAEVAALRAEIEVMKRALRQVLRSAPG